MHILLNWILEGAIVAVATAGGLRLLRGAPAATRHRVCWAALVAILALPLVPFLWTATSVLVSAPPELLTVGSTDAALPPNGVGPIVTPLVRLPAMFSVASVLLGTAWMLWAMLQGVRVVRDLRWLRRARRRCHALPAHVAARFAPETRRLVDETGARVVLCDAVRAAAVLGGGRPLIGLHARIVDALTPCELNAVLVHELAHVARHDAHATVLQRAVHVLVGWHPGVWWAMRRLTLEREMACDETALAAAGGPKAYAACLTRIAGLALAPARSPEFAMGMLGASGLYRRVVHVLTPGRFSRRTAGLAGGTLSTSLCALAVALGTVAIFGEPAIADGVAVLETATSSLAQPRGETRGADAGSVRRMAVQDRAKVSTRLTRSSTATSSLATRTDAQSVALAATQTAAQRTVVTEAAAGTVDTTPVAAPVAVAPAASAPVVEAPVAISPVPASAGTTQASHNRTVTDVAVETAVGTAAGATGAWNATADAAASTGVAVGRGTQRGAVNTAGAFARWGRRVASSF